MDDPTKGRYQVATVLQKQATLARKVDDLTKLLAEKEVETARLKSELQKAIFGIPSTSNANDEMLQKFRGENALLLASND